jgi:hypothetical protein
MITELHPLLVQPLIEYLGEGRPALLRAAQHSTPIAAATSLTTHRYVFVNRSGRPFSAPSWTQLVQGVFERETGRRIGNNLLRDSFVTHVYAGDVSDRLKHALAEHMGHRVQTAERVYNRMPGVERGRPALELASQLALGLGTPGSGSTGSGTAGSGARSSGTTGSGAAAAALGVRGGAAGEGTGMNTWAQPSPRHSTSTSMSTSASTSASRWSTAARADSYSSEEEELTLDEEDEHEEDEHEHEEEHESPPNHDWIDACLRSTSSSSSSSSSSSTLPSPFRTDLPPASTGASAFTRALDPATIGSIETTSATPITATGGVATQATQVTQPRRQRAPMRCKTPGCDGSGSTRPYKLTHCSMRCCPKRTSHTSMPTTANGLAGPRMST